LKITVAEMLEALTELVNERQPLGIDRSVYQNALKVIARIDDLGRSALALTSPIKAEDLWRIVPATATKAMSEAFWRDADCSPNQWRFSASYRAMLEAAPQPINQPVVIGIDYSNEKDKTVTVVKHG
jgi:hypothetical protein